MPRPVDKVGDRRLWALVGHWGRQMLNQGASEGKSRSLEARAEYKDVRCNAISGYVAGVVASVDI